LKIAPTQPVGAFFIGSSSLHFMNSWAHERPSGCKVNLLLNILGKRSDGFHELETVMYPIRIFDQLRFGKARSGIELTCSEPSLPVDRQNLVYRAAEAFLTRVGISEGVRLHLKKKIPLAAGLGGGSGNAANTLLGLNHLFGTPLNAEALQAIASSLGSDIPFFLQTEPAVAIGRGESIHPLGALPALENSAFILIHPGFGISTAWAYQTLANFPGALNGVPGRAQKLAATLKTQTLVEAAPQVYNSLEAPALHKYPLLKIFQDFLRSNGAAATLMSGSGSTTFGITKDRSSAEKLVEKFKSKFGDSHWVSVVDA
jgi:4-diphosphocytidyl-2-C-methyl-D-erythritol kinase